MFCWSAETRIALGEEIRGKEAEEAPPMQLRILSLPLLLSRRLTAVPHSQTPPAHPQEAKNEATRGCAHQVARGWKKLNGNKENYFRSALSNQVDESWIRNCAGWVAEVAKVSGRTQDTVRVPSGLNVYRHNTANYSASWEWK